MVQHGLADRRTFTQLSRGQLAAKGHPEEIVHGLPCFVDPAKNHGSAPAPENADISFWACYSPEYDLYLFQEFDMTNRISGLTVRQRTELYNLKLGSKPEQGAVGIPDGFVIQEGLCSACSHPGGE